MHYYIVAIDGDTKNPMVSAAEADPFTNKKDALKAARFIADEIARQHDEGQPPDYFGLYSFTPAKVRRLRWPRVGYEVITNQAVTLVTVETEITP